MPTATETLRHEHEAILKMLTATEEVARRIDSGKAVNPEILSGLLEFLQLFADRCHHGKEEEHLFPKLEQKGFAHNAGPIAVMLKEHNHGRELISKMAAAAEAYAHGNKEAGKRWAEAARAYAGLLRAHIQKENQVLFVMAEQALSSEEQEELSQAFEEVELEKLGAGTHERLHALMDELYQEIFEGKTAGSEGGV
jgi:hemerythrin-like domain-containing protein